MRQLENVRVSSGYPWQCLSSSLTLQSLGKQFLFGCNKVAAPQLQIVGLVVFAKTKSISSLLADKGPPDAIKEKYKEAQIPLKEHSNTLPSIGTVLNHFRYRRKCSIALKIHSVALQIKLI